MDPLRYDLFFERFLNTGRTDPPDIDVDFPWDERDDILDYVFRAYGTGRVAMIANQVGFRARAAVRETAKVYGLPEGEIAEVTRRLGGWWSARTALDEVRRHPLFKDYQLRPPWPEILARAGELEGFPRHLSVHSGGVVIAPDELNRYVPREPTPKGVSVIQWEKDQAEDAGLIKLDLLGNRSLAVIRDALTAVEGNYGHTIPYERFNPLDDLRTRELIGRGDTLGVFYVESPAMRQLQKKTRRGDFEHLVIHSSIIRPAANVYIREYVRRLHGGAYRPLHPLLGEILGETYGIMCYQEDVAKVAMAMAGFSAAEADRLRKILSKKRSERALADYRERFAAGARARGFAPETIGAVWEMIMSFSGYSFCKPHSASYALVSFKSCYLRAHYPAEFMAAVISNGGGYYRAFAYVSEARRMGLAVLPPCVNASDARYTGRGRELRVGLAHLKGLGRAALEEVLAARRAGGPFENLDDLLRRTDLDPADLRVLIKAGALDCLATAAAEAGARRHGRDIERGDARRGKRRHRRNGGAGMTTAREQRIEINVRALGRAGSTPYAGPKGQGRAGSTGMESNAVIGERGSGKTGVSLRHRNQKARRQWKGTEAWDEMMWRGDGTNIGAAGDMETGTARDGGENGRQANGGGPEGNGYGAPENRPQLMWRAAARHPERAPQVRRRGWRPGELFAEPDFKPAPIAIQGSQRSPSPGSGGEVLHARRAPAEARGGFRRAPLPRPPRYDLETVLRHEAETLGFLASRHPLSLHREALARIRPVPARDLARHVGQRVTVVGWLVTGKLVRTKSAEEMEFLSFEDTTALYEATFFPHAYRRFCHLLARERPYVLRGVVEEDWGAVTLTVEWCGVLAGG